MTSDNIKRMLVCMHVCIACSQQFIERSSHEKIHQMAVVMWRHFAVYDITLRCCELSV